MSDTVNNNNNTDICITQIAKLMPLNAMNAAAKSVRVKMTAMSNLFKFSRPMLPESKVY